MCADRMRFRVSLNAQNNSGYNIPVFYVETGCESHFSTLACALTSRGVNWVT